MHLFSSLSTLAVGRLVVDWVRRVVLGGVAVAVLVPHRGADAAGSSSPLLVGRLDRVAEGWTGISDPRSGFCGRRRFLPASSCAAL
jgi:hypothetical protein